MEETLLVHWATHLHLEQERRPEATGCISFLRVFFFPFVFLSFLFSLNVHQFFGVEGCISAVTSVVSSVLITYSLSVVTQWFLF